MITAKAADRKEVRDEGATPRPGFPEAAYIGVDGLRHRLLVPVRRIRIKRVEGPRVSLGSWSFGGYAGVDSHLTAAMTTAPRSGYHKHDFDVLWADGRTHEGRYDLANDGRMQSLATHIRRHLRHVAQDPRAALLFSDDLRIEAARMLTTHDLEQPPVPASSEAMLLHDYREGSVPVRELQERHFGAE